MTGTRQPALPAGYDYDYINAEVLLQRARVVNGRLAIPDGPSYALLVLPPQDTMRPELLSRIRDLVSEGARVFGPPPARSPSLAGFPACDQQVARLAEALWGDLAKRDGTGLVQRAFGKGRVFLGDNLAGALREVGSEPALVAPANILWTHRKDGEAEIFFLSNQNKEPVLAELSFRVSGLAPELWYPDTGKRETSAWFEPNGGRTRVPVALDAGGSVFVVFLKAASGASVARVLKDGVPVAAAGGIPCPVRVTRLAAGGVAFDATEPGRYTLVRTDGKESVLEVSLPPPVAFTGPWTFRLPAGSGADQTVVLPQLVSWSEHADDAVKCFSGTAAYTTRFDLPAEALKPGRRLTLDLGAVEVMAEVRVNGKALGTLWKRPFAVDITDAVRSGTNEIEVKVTNLWWNRLVGDGKLPPENRTTFTTAQPRVPRTKLLPSGLLGPAAITISETIICKEGLL
jgi:hypothetical protein